MLLFIGGAEIILIVFVVLLLFGAKKIPEVARAMGKGYREFQKATEDIKREISDFDTDTSLKQSKNKQSNPSSNNNTENQHEK
jgi:sec-independent protein translocase protein TatA